jgi:uncharacterized protein (TIGR03000 family)
VITVSVPYDAKVTINGLLTKSTGSERKFFSSGMLPGAAYEYQVKAEVVRDGKVLVETHSVLLRAGERNSVVFGFSGPGTEGLATTE